MSATIRFGTCSWNYPSWMGLVYSERHSRAAAYLREYSRKYESVEIDSWFYKIPDSEEVADYLSQVPPEFRFTCKVPQELTLTHLRGRAGVSTMEPNPDFLSAERFEVFLGAIEPMLPQLDALIFEFEYLNRDKMPSLDAFLEKLDRFLASVRGSGASTLETQHQLPIAIETRNKNFLGETYFAFLREKRLMPVFSEKLYMPHVSDVYRHYKDYIDTDVVVRLLGGDRAEIEKRTGEHWNAIAEPKPEKPEIMKMSLDLVYGGHGVSINVNNHYEGSAPLTIEALRAIASGLSPRGGA